MIETERKEKMNELMNKISLSLKDANLQQGFEIICQRIAELEKENEDLKKENEGLKAFESHCDEIEEDAKVIAEENAELKEKVSYLEDNLRVARKDRENLQLKVGKGLKEFIKDCPYSALKLYANGYYVEQLAKAKELIEELSSSLSVVGECEEEECELLNRAEQFIKE